METIEAIETRRSIRRYTDKAVDEATIMKILKAAMQAPSAGNGQPWHFIVVQDKKLLEKIASIHPHALMAKEAQFAIIVCGDKKLELYDGFWIQDCSASVENLLLAAHALGLGAVWCGIFPRQDRVDEFKRAFEIPINVIPLAVVPVGYPGETRLREDRFKPERVHKNKW